MRIEGVIQEIISTLILTGKVKDPRISRMVSINRVKCASDLKKGDRLTTVFADGSVESEII